MNLREKTLIVAQDYEGHRLIYVRLLVMALLERGETPVIALTDHGRKSDEFKLNCADLQDHCEVAELPRLPVSPSSVYGIAREHYCTRVILPDGDRFAMRQALAPPRRGLHTVLLVMQDPSWCISSSPTHRIKMRAKAFLLQRAEQKPGTTILYLSDHFETPVRPTQLLAPDPVLFDAADLDPATLRRDFGLAQEKFWFLIAGKISPRKNLSMVALGMLALDSREIGLFVCGSIDPEVKAAIAPLMKRLNERGISVVMDDRIQTDPELNQAIQAADCVVVAYSSDQPTSMMAKSVRAGRRIVVAGSPSLRHWAGNLGIQLVGRLEQEEINNLMASAVRLPPPAPRTDLGHSRFIEALLK